MTVRGRPAFLAGGGEAAELIGAFDWSATSVGPIEAWSPALTATTALILRSPVPIVTLWGEDGVMIYNDSYSVFAGGRHPRLLGSKVREGWPEVAAFNDNVMRVCLAGGTLSYEDQELTLFRHGHGEQVWMNLDYSPVIGTDGRPEGVISIVVETTAKVRAEQALAALNAELEQRVQARTRERDQIWRLSTDLMLVADFQARIMGVNPAWTAMLGWRPDELTGMDLLGLVHPDDVASTLREVGKLAQGHTTLRFENRYRDRAGKYRWLSWTAVPEGDMLHAVGRDVQAEKEAAAMLRSTEAALRQSQKMEAVGQLTGGIAHDFNNLLTGIGGSLELLRKRMAQGRASEVDRFIDAAMGATRRAAALTHRLLAFSRQQTLDPQPTDVNRLMGGMEELIRRSVGPGVAVEVVGAAGLWPTLIDAPQLETALLNLCINARDAMPDGGRLTIETANTRLDARMAGARELEAGDYVALNVTDTGTGMTPEVMARAFDPFFTTKPIGQGTGLGLSMIYGFVRQSGGQVRIYSERGHGTTLCLYLPRHHGLAAPLGDRPVTPEPEAQGRGRPVLVVDDEDTVRMLVKEVLSTQGYDVTEAADAAAALRILAGDAPIALLVTDVGLPGGTNGRQLADAARLARPGLPVLFITGYAETALLERGQLAPDMHIMTKPFDMDILAARVAQLLPG